MKKQPLALAELVPLLGLMMSLVALSISSILPALPAISESLGVADHNQTQFVITLFFLGMVCGEIFFGTLSDTIGRKKALLTGIAIYCCGTVIAATAQSLEVLLLGRVVQGFGVSGPKTVSVALVRDQYAGNAMARVMSFVMTIFIMVPMVAPTIGQWIQGMAGWRAIFILFLTQAVLVSGWFALRQPETLPPEKRKPFSLRTTLQSARVILKNTKTMAYTATAGLALATHYTFVSMAQAMFADMYHVGKHFPLYFALLAMGIFIASILNGKFVMRLGMFRLVMSAWSCLIVVSGCLLLAGFSNEGVPPFFAFVVACFLVFFCLGILFGNMSSMAMQSLGENAGLGASMVGSMSGLLGVLLSMVIGQFYNQTIFPLAVGYIVLASCALGLVMVAQWVVKE